MQKESTGNMLPQKGLEMGESGISMPIKQLQPASHEAILNVIDNLRSEGISNYVDLPQMVVCGDQSSGKSSVLEAISGVNFPMKENLCTRFATELILRRDPEIRTKVSIIPNKERPKEEQTRLENFEPANANLESFKQIVLEAGSAMQRHESDQSFSKDVLRVEVCGPEQPHLTLVDLPGLYHAPDEKQDEDGIVCVQNLVRSYIERPRSVILAVISAKNEIALQEVTALVKEVDPQGSRTLGIITKPDMLSRGSEQEEAFFALARNSNAKVNFRLGWHVLKNRTYEEREHSLADRNNSERNFFSQTRWCSLSPSCVGIETLVPKLCDILNHHIQDEMPSFIADTIAACEETSAGLEKLGDQRDSLPDQRRFLLNGSQKFTMLMNNSLHGVYFDEFFESGVNDERYAKRLRAVIQNRLASFAEAMEERGESTSILEEDEDLNSGQEYPYRFEFMEDVRKRMRRSRGRELPGNFNPLIVGELFFEQARPWKGIVSSYANMLLTDVKNAAVLMLQDVFPQPCVEGLLKYIVNCHLSQLGDDLHAKIAELLRPQQAGHPITYNSQYVRNVQEMRDRQLRKSITQKLKTFFGSKYTDESRADGRFLFRMEDLIDKVSSRSESDMELFACSDAIGCMVAYYRVAMEKFVDDFSSLAIEECLVKPLQRIFQPATVELMKNDVVRAIAREDENVRAERARLTKKQKVLKRSLQKMNQYNLKAHHTVHSQDNEMRKEDNMLPQDEEEDADESRIHADVEHDLDPLVEENSAYEGVHSPARTEEANVEVFDEGWVSIVLSPTSSKKKKKHRIASQFEWS